MVKLQMNLMDCQRNLWIAGSEKRLQNYKDCHQGKKILVHKYGKNTITHSEESRALNMKCGIQFDGQKFKGEDGMENVENTEMSMEDARWRSFKKFPKPELIQVLYESGYYYTGVDDIVKCHRCDAKIHKWTKKDIPSTFHEANCLYTFVPTKDEMMSVQDTPTSNSLQPSSNMSILDAPVTYANSIIKPPEVLTPTPAPVSCTSVVKTMPNPTQSSHRSLEVNMYEGDPYANTTAQHTAQIDTQNFNTFDVEEDPQYYQKLFVAKANRHHVNLAKIICEEHKRLLPILNLFSEEDRRKTFGGWSREANNVLHYTELARDGFFYLGNSDRTQCFSCEKVLTKWVPGDNVNQVHTMTVPSCRMATGRESRNIPIPIWQASPSHSSTSSSLELISFQGDKHVEGNVTYQESSEERIPALPTPSSFETRPANATGSIDRINSIPIYRGKVETTSLPQPGIRGNRSPGVPLDLSRNRAHIPPLERERGHGDRFLHEREYTAEANFRSMPTMSQKITVPKLQGISMEDLRGIQPEQDEEESEPISSQSPPEVRTVSPPIPPISISSHIGQTTLYGASSAIHSAHVATEPFVATPIPRSSVPVLSPTESNLRELFPCLDPATPRYANAIDRQETFDFRLYGTSVGAPVDELSKAGFYYTGDGERVRCWYCNGSILHWNPDDDPWEDHARLYPTCEYLLQQRGPEYVSEVQARIASSSPRESLPTSVPRFVSSASSSESNSSISLSPPGSPRITILGRRIRIGGRSNTPPPRVIDPREEETNNRSELERAMNSETIITAMDMGFDLRTIRKVIKRKIWSTRSAFSTAQDLLDALLNAHQLSSSSEESEEENLPAADPNASSSAGSAAPTPSTARSGDLLNPTGAASASQPRSLPREDVRGLDSKELDSKLREYEQEKRCKVCLDRNAEVVFFPCGHVCTCVQCANALRVCPICRKRIQKSMRIYTS